jgi:mono/diheme cytochrome c family protein
MNRRIVVALVGAMALTVFSIPAFAGGAPDAAGIYKAKCSMCHGPDGSGQTKIGISLKVRDLRSADVQKQSDADLAKMISAGKGKMPAYKSKLSAEEIDSLVTFIRDLVKK